MEAPIIMGQTPPKVNIKGARRVPEPGEERII